MQMLSSTILCPRCGARAMVTVFGPTGGDVSLGELSFTCPEGHLLSGDVSRDEVIDAWTKSRAHHSPAV